MKTPIELITEERKRQQEVEGWTLENDDRYTDESLATVAGYYALPCNCGVYLGTLWPSSWCVEWDKKGETTRLRDLTKAGALIVAEMERLQRAEVKAGKTCKECGTELNHVGGCENGDCDVFPF